MYEPLETRVLLAVTFSGGKITVTGTPGNDVISLNLVGNRVAVFENRVQTASFKAVRSIEVHAGDGRDRVTIDPSIAVPTRIDGGASADTLIGGSGPDVLIGGGGHDYLVGGAGADALLGGANDDILDGGLGNDYLEGGGGKDTVTYESRSQAVAFVLRVDGQTSVVPITYGTATVGGEQDKLAHVETLVGGSGNDSFRISSISYDESYALPLGLEARGMAGNDYFFGGSLQAASGAAVRFYGGDGNDHFTPDGYVVAEAYGEAGDDRFDDGDDDTGVMFTSFGGDGRDTLIVDGLQPASRLPDASYGIEDADILSGLYLPEDADGDQSFRGNALDNRIAVFDMNGGLVVLGGDGNDRITAEQAGEILIRGEAGNDVIRGGNFADTLDGGPGDDAIFGNGENDALIGGTGNDYLEGGLGDDFLVGNGGNDTLRGGPGVDRMEGHAGDDVFYSRDKTGDILYGGSGNDSAQRDASEQILDSIEKTLA